MILSALLFTLAIVAYSIKELQSFGKLKWMKVDDSFWGNKSYLRKYEMTDWPNKVRTPIAPPNTWYYNFFKIQYKENFPGSATIFAMFTDGFHMCQALAKIFICAAFYPLTNWWFPFVLWCLWTIVWNLCDKYLTK